MNDKKDEEYSNISIEAMVKKLSDERTKILNEFTKAYLAETGLLPSQLELVTRQMPIDNGIIESVFFFRKKE